MMLSSDVLVPSSVAWCAQCSAIGVREGFSVATVPTDCPLLQEVFFHRAPLIHTHFPTWIMG